MKNEKKIKINIIDLMTMTYELSIIDDRELARDRVGRKLDAELDR